jgi:hypothetical protein
MTCDIGDSLQRENEFFRKYYFPATPEEQARARALREADRSQGRMVDDAEADHQAARDGYNPSR